MFRVTSLDGKELSGSAEKNDFADDFFARSAYLTVSGQLSGEAYACALGDVYTFGPTFPSGELADGAPFGGVLDDRAGDRVRGRDNGALAAFYRCWKVEFTPSNN